MKPVANGQITSPGLSGTPSSVSDGTSFTSGSSGLYLFAYSIMYFFTQLDIIGFVPTLIYFTYMLVFAVLFFLITGTIGFYSCHCFVHVIYGAIKVD